MSRSKVTTLGPTQKRYQMAVISRIFLLFLFLLLLPLLLLFLLLLLCYNKSIKENQPQ